MSDLGDDSDGTAKDAALAAATARAEVAEKEVARLLRTVQKLETIMRRVNDEADTFARAYNILRRANRELEQSVLGIQPLRPSHEGYGK